MSSDLNNREQSLGRLHKSLFAFWKWLVTGLAVFLPNFVRKRWAYKPWKLVIAEDQNGDVVQTLILRNALAEEKQALNLNDISSVPNLEIHLPQNQAYETTLTLPPAAWRRLRSAARLQLSELSPFPLNDTAFGVRLLGQRDDRLVAKVLLGRRSKILKLAGNLNWSQSFCVKAMTADGSLETIEEAFTPLRMPERNQVLPYAIVAVSLFLLVFAYHDRNVRIGERLEATRTAYIDELKDMRARGEQMTAAKAAFAVQQNNQSTDDLLEALEILHATLPQNARLAQTALNGSSVSASGFVLSDAELATTLENSWRISNSTRQSAARREGYDALSLTLTKGEAQQ